MIFVDFCDDCVRIADCQLPIGDSKMPGRNSRDPYVGRVDCVGQLQL